LISMAPSPASPATVLSPHGSETIDGSVLHIPPYWARLWDLYTIVT
jgi:hypothetical protein